MPEWLNSRSFWAVLVLLSLSGGFAAGMATDDIGALANLADSIVRLLGGDP